MTAAKILDKGLLIMENFMRMKKFSLFLFCTCFILGSSIYAYQPKNRQSVNKTYHLIGSKESPEVNIPGCSFLPPIRK